MKLRSSRRGRNLLAIVCTPVRTAVNIGRSTDRYVRRDADWRRPFLDLRVAPDAAQGRGFAVRSLPPDDELPLLDDEPLPEDADGDGGGLYVLRGRSDAVPVELPCVCV